MEYYSHLKKKNRKYKIKQTLLRNLLHLSNKSETLCIHLYARCTFSITKLSSYKILYKKALYKIQRTNRKQYGIHSKYNR